MKFLFLVTSFLIATTTFAGTTLSRNNDGMDAQCSTKINVGTRFYRLSIQSENLTETSNDVALEVKFFTCVEDGKEFKVVPTSSADVLHSYIILNDGTLGVTDNKLVSVNFYTLDTAGEQLTNLSMMKTPDTFVLYLSFDKNVKKAYVLSDLTSDITSPIGSLLNYTQTYGGYVLSFE